MKCERCGSEMNKENRMKIPAFRGRPEGTYYQEVCPRCWSFKEITIYKGEIPGIATPQIYGTIISKYERNNSDPQVISCADEPKKAKSGIKKV